MDLCPRRRKVDIRRAQRDRSSLTIGLNREWPGATRLQEQNEAERRATPDWAVRTKPLAFAADAAPMEFGSGFQKFEGDVGGRCAVMAG